MITEEKYSRPYGAYLAFTYLCSTIQVATCKNRLGVCTVSLAMCFDWNSQNYTVIVFYAITDFVCMGNEKSNASWDTLLHALPYVTERYIKELEL